MKKTDSRNIISSVSISKLGLKAGDPYDEAIIALVDLLCENTEIKTDLSCLFDDCEECDCSKVEDIPQAIECLMNAIKGLSAENISLGESETNGLFRGVSDAGVTFSGKKLPFKVQSTKEGSSSFTYDLNPFAADLPGDCVLSSVRVIACGSDGKKNVILRDTDLKSTSIEIPYSKFPAKVDFDMRVTTGEGDLKLYGTAYIPIATDQDGHLYFDVNDYTSGSRKMGSTIADFIKAMTGKLKILFSYYEGLKSYNNVGGEYVSSSVGIQSSIGAITAALEKACAKIEELEAKIEGCNCGGEKDCD